MNDVIVYTKEQIEVVEELAASFLTVEDIAISIGVDGKDLKRDIKAGGEISIAYKRGKTKSKVDLFKLDMELAKSGSPLGMEAVKEHLMDMEESELL